MALIDEYDDQTKQAMADSTPKPDFADQRKEISSRYQKLLADSRVKQRAVRGARGGVQGASSLNDDPEVRRAVTSNRALARDYRLARREAIRRNDRAGALAISERARKAGINIHGISRHGDDTRAAAIAIQAQRAANAFDKRSMVEMANEMRDVAPSSERGVATTTKPVATKPKDTKPQQVVDATPDPSDQVGFIGGRGASVVLDEMRNKQNAESAMANAALHIGALPFGVRLAPSFNPFTKI